MKIKRYNKLIRDKIPEILLKKEVVPEIKVIKDDKEFLRYLQKKILEESREISKEKNVSKLKEELADLIEVCDWLIKVIGTTKKEIQIIRKEKNNIRGSFKRKIVLLETKE